MAMMTNNAGGMVGGLGQMVSSNAAGGMIGTGINQALPNYLGSPYDFSGSTVPGFYNINPETFPFYAMRNQLDQGVYTPGRPKFTPFNVNSPNSFAGVNMPSGRSLYTIDPDMSTGYPTDPLAQEMLRRSYSTPRTGINTNPEAYASPQAYNQAMRQHAAKMAELGRPMMAYYNPRFSGPRQIVSRNVGGLLST